MTEVVPFQGVFYNREKVSGEVVAPPYDVISTEMHEALYAQSPYNVVRIDFGMKNTGDSDEDNRYTRANSFLNTWIKKEILITSDKPCYYAYRMEFTVRGQKKQLIGLFGLVKLVELGKGVFPHEATHSKPKKDRLSLMTEAGANTSPIYSLYKSEKNQNIKNVLDKATSQTPYLEATATDDTGHAMWLIEDDADIASIKDSLEGVNIFIADGHHRYETAIEYQRMMREAKGEGPHDYVLMFLADIEDPELIALPTHRLVTVDTDTLIERLSHNFEVTKIGAKEDILNTIEGKDHAFGLYAGGDKYVITCKVCGLDDVRPELKDLDVVVLHKLIFGKLLEIGSWGYEKEYETTISMVDDGEYDAAFFLNPTSVASVESVAVAGLRMPPKSTYFYPKVQTGFLINSLK